MKDKLLISGLSAILVLFYFLVSNYFGGFVTRAEYNGDKIIFVKIQKDIEYIKKQIQ